METTLSDRTGDERLPSGSIIHWSERAAEKVFVTCGGCRGRRLLRIQGGNRWLGKTLFCHQCTNPRRAGDEKLPSGSVIHWSERDGDKVAATCGGCGKKVFSSTFTSKTGYQNWCCHSCRVGKHTGDERHKSGTVIHWDMRPERDPWTVSITCHRCGHNRFVKVQSIRSETWGGLCSPCVKEIGVPHPLKKYEDKQLLSGSVVLFSRRDECQRKRELLEIWVRCGICGTDNLFRRRSVNKKDFEGYCPKKHTRAEIVRMYQAQTQNGSAHTEQRAPRFDREQFVVRVRKFIVEVWREKGMKSPDKIYRKDVAQKFSLRGWKPTTGAGVWANLEACDELVDVSEGWTAFVLSVVRDASEKS